MAFYRPMDHAMPDAAEEPSDGCSWESRMLMEHAELAMRNLRLVTKMAEDAQWVGTGGDKMFARFSHAMQVSIALKARLEREARQQRREAVQARRSAEAEARGQCKAAVEQVVEAAIEKIADPAEAARLRLDLGVRLGQLDIEREIADKPIREVVAGVCRELGITPDMPEWPSRLFGQEAPGDDGPGLANASDAGVAAAGARVGAGRDPP
jgi:hypothetical protein